MLKDQKEIREKENHRVFKQLLNTFAKLPKSETQIEENKEEYAQNVQIVPKIFVGRIFASNFSSSIGTISTFSSFKTLFIISSFSQDNIEQVEYTSSFPFFNNFIAFFSNSICDIFDFSINFSVKLSLFI